jgi:hypothetical protein
VSRAAATATRTRSRVAGSAGRARRPGGEAVGSNGPSTWWPSSASCWPSRRSRTTGSGIRSIIAWACDSRRTMARMSASCSRMRDAPSATRSTSASCHDENGSRSSPAGEGDDPGDPPGHPERAGHERPGPERAGLVEQAGPAERGDGGLADQHVVESAVGHEVADRRCTVHRSGGTGPRSGRRRRAPARSPDPGRAPRSRRRAAGRGARRGRPAAGSPRGGARRRRRRAGRRAPMDRRP